MSAPAPLGGSGTKVKRPPPGQEIERAVEGSVAGSPGDSGQPVRGRGGNGRGEPRPVRA
jgi:hypothetical protein